jgi:hypothetical protein
MIYWRKHYVIFRQEPEEKGRSSMDPVALSSLTAGVSVLANECLKGIASEAGKTVWESIKSLLGWSSDPAPAEIPEKIAKTVSASPQVAQQLLELLTSKQTGTATALVGTLQVSGGKVVVAGHINRVQM